MRCRCIPLAFLAAWISSPAHATCVEYSTHLRQLAKVDTPGFAQHLALSDNLLVVADEEQGFSIYDVSDPESPALLSSFNTWGFALDVELAGNTLYVADWITLQSFDLTDPQNPAFLDAVGVSGKAQGLTLSGTTAFVASGDGGLQIVDVSNPGALSLIGTMFLPGHASDVVVVASHAYVATGRPGPFHDIEVVDVSNPSSPLPVTSFDAGSEDDNAERLSTDGSFLYVAGSNLSVIDVRLPSAPVQIAVSEWPGDAEDVALNGTYAYIADFISGIQVFDVSDPWTPRLVGAIDAPNSSRGVAAGGNLAFLALLGNGFRVFDCTNPQSPPLIGQAETSLRTRAIANEGDLAVLALGDAGIQTIDLSNPSSPLVLGSFDPGYATNLVVEGGLAYINGSGTGTDLTVINVGTSPGQPVIVGELPGIFSDGLAKVGPHIFSGSGNGIAVINVSTPASPALVTTFPTSGNHRHLLANDTTLYASDSVAGLLILNVSNPAAPSILGSLSGAGFANGLALEGTILWSSNGSGGIQAVDVSNPANPAVIGSASLPEDILDLTVHSGIVYATTPGGAVLVIEGHNPSAPSYLGETLHVGLTEDVLVHEDHLYAAATRSLSVFPLECPFPTAAPWIAREVPFELSISPNPVSHEAVISFELSQSAPVRVSICDISGRSVRREEERMRSAGHHSWMWNACDDHGIPLASGVYFVRLTVFDRESLTKKVVLRR